MCSFVSAKVEESYYSNVTSGILQFLPESALILILFCKINPAKPLPIWIPLIFLFFIFFDLREEARKKEIRK